MRVAACTALFVYAQFAVIAQAQTSLMPSGMQETEGLKSVTLRRAPKGRLDHPQFLSVTVIPDHGMDVFQITANLPGQGETQLLVAVVGRMIGVRCLPPQEKTIDSWPLIGVYSRSGLPSGGGRLVYYESQPLRSLVILSALRRVLLQSRQVLRLYKEANGSGLPRGSFDEAVALQCLDHIVNRRRRNLKVALQVRLCWSLAVDLSVVVNEGQILSLFYGE